MRRAVPTSACISASTIYIFLFDSYKMACGEAADVLKEMEDNLTCSICQEIFIEPRILPCHHVYCTTCLGQYLHSSTRAGKARCPLCCTETTVPAQGATGFPVAFLQAYQVQTYNKLLQLNLSQEQGMSCTLCSDDGPRKDATNFCPDCSEALCKSCSKIHTKLQPSHTSIPSIEISQQQLLLMLRNKTETKCKIHAKKVSLFCETCDQLICESCSSVPHKKHTQISLKVAYDKHKLQLETFLKNILEQQALREDTVKQARQASSGTQKQKEEGLRKLDEQEGLLVRAVRDHITQLKQEVIQKSDEAADKIRKLIDTVEKEMSHMQGCIQHIQLCFQQGTQADVVQTSIENAANFRSTITELGQPLQVLGFQLSVECPSKTKFQADMMAKLKCNFKMETPKPTSRTVCEEPNMPIVKSMGAKPMKMTANKLMSFKVDVTPAGISCTPAGDIVVCEWDGTKAAMYSKDGRKVRDLKLPDGIQTWDCECTNTCIYFTDQMKAAIHIYSLSGKFIESKLITNIEHTDGIAIHGSHTYITDATSEVVYRLDVTKSSRSVAPTRIADKLKLQTPWFACASSTTVAVSDCGKECVYMLDTQGRLKYTHGTSGQMGSQDHQLSGPLAVVLDSQDRLFISDNGNDRVCVLSDQGSVLGHINLEEIGLDVPRGLVINNEGHLLVACGTEGNNQVVKYSYSFQ